ncbi:hypothetical protein [Motilimonas cestriensis]|uniref:hypothetical protein n=1 Tax=Motilimonas cestriensis TaxID=2742685 RepID=UPI003DA5A328
MEIVASLIGRFIFCYLLVFLFIWFYSKFDYKQAVYRLHSKKSMFVIVLLLIIPFLASVKI